MPEVREAIEQRLWKEAESQIGLSANVLTAYANWLSAAAKATAE